LVNSNLPMSFVSWLGAKTKQLSDIIPKILAAKKDIYIEPFLGSGTVLLSLLQQTEVPKYILVNDLNTDLINTFIQIKENCALLIESLSKYQNITEQQFYELRKNYNSIKTTDPIKRATLFILLTKTAFRNMYAVNKKGKFMTSYSSKYQPKKYYDEQQLHQISKSIQNVEFYNQSYVEFLAEKLHQYNPADMIIYLDPPYFGQFDKYTNSRFQYPEFDNVVIKLHLLHAKLIVSNTINWPLPLDFTYKKQNILKDRINRKNPSKERIELLLANF